MLYILHGNIDQTLVHLLHGLLKCEIGELDLLHSIHLLCNTLVHSIYSDILDCSTVIYLLNKICLKQVVDLHNYINVYKLPDQNKT